MPAHLNNSGENLALQAPDTPNTNLVPYVTVEAVRFNNKAPWPPGADGTGFSLQRVVAFAYGNEPANWVAAAPTPGRLYGSGDTDGDGLPDAWEMANGTLVYTPDADADPDGDGFTNMQEYLAGTNPNDPGSALQFEHVAALPNAITLVFNAVSNHTYSVVYKTSLTNSAWQKLSDVATSPVNHSVRLTNSTAGTSTRFYRLVTPAQP